METECGLTVGYTVIMPAENVFFAFQNASYSIPYDLEFSLSFNSWCYDVLAISQ